MKAVLAILCVLFATAYGNILDHLSPQQSNQRDLVKLRNQVKFMAHAGRGFISGYRRGMYKEINFRVDPKCLDGTT